MWSAVNHICHQADGVREKWHAVIGALNNVLTFNLGANAGGGYIINPLDYGMKYTSRAVIQYEVTDLVPHEYIQWMNVTIMQKWIISFTSTGTRAGEAFINSIHTIELLRNENDSQTRPVSISMFLVRYLNTKSNLYFQFVGKLSQWYGRKQNMLLFVKLLWLWQNPWYYSCNVLPACLGTKHY